MITIYGTRGCGFCKMSVDKCRKLGYKYTYKDASIINHYKELQKLNIDTRKMPHIFVDNTYLGTYHEFLEYTQRIRESNEMA